MGRKKKEVETISLSLCVNIAYSHVDTAVENEEFTESIMNLLKVLAPRERDIVERHLGFYGDRETFKEIGEFYGFTKERASQIYHKALRKMRRPDAISTIADFI